MEKKIDAIKTSSLVTLVETLNTYNISKEDIVQIICNSYGEYIVIFYKEYGEGK